MRNQKRITRGNLEVGDIVEFKSDIEQAGKIVKIVRNDLWLQALTDDGFDGDYIGGQMNTVISKDDVFYDEDFQR